MQAAVDVPTDTAAARAVRVTKIYGQGGGAVAALDDVSVAFEAGTFTAVMGPSGSGKSTLLHLLGGLDTPTRGQIHLQGRDIGRASQRALTVLRRDRIGVAFQAYNLLPTLTVAENIRLPVALAGRRPDPAWLERLVSSLGLAEQLRRRPAELSGGQQQRVAVARALITRPELLLADEPTGALDSATGADLLALLQATCRDTGQTIVMVTHDATVASYAQRTVFLADGRVTGELADPTPDAVLDRIRRLERSSDHEGS
jgi:putative ABC transport system ATP-binding protein